MVDKFEQNEAAKSGHRPENIDPLTKAPRESLHIIRTASLSNQNDKETRSLPDVSIHTRNDSNHPAIFNLDLNNPRKLLEHIENLGLNDAKNALKAMRDDLKARGYDPQKRTLGYGTDINTNNPRNPFINLDNLYRPNPQISDFLALRQQKSKDLEKKITLNPLSTATQPQSDLFGTAKLQSANADKQATEKTAAKDIALLSATSKQKEEYSKLQSLELLDENNPNTSALLPFASHISFKTLSAEEQESFISHLSEQRLSQQNWLLDRLKAPIDQLNPEQVDIVSAQLDLLDVLQKDHLLANHVDRLQNLYTEKNWRDDSKWYGVDDQEFLADLRQADISTVSHPDRFRALAVIDRLVKAHRFSSDKSNTDELLLGQETIIRKELQKDLQKEIAKLNTALSTQQGSQGIASNGADWVIGHIGIPNSIFMDSTATSQAVRANLETANQAIDDLKWGMSLIDNHAEFAQRYKKSVTTLAESLKQANESLAKMAEAHQGRVEGISDLAQFGAAATAIAACAAAAPETFGGSLAAIPVVAPMAAGAAAKVATKLLESKTSQTGTLYPPTTILVDGSIAALASAPFLPGGKIAKSLQAESATAGQQVAAATYRSFATGVAKRTAGYSLTGAVDGATINGARAVLNGENPLRATSEGAVGGAILGPVIGPAVKYTGKYVAQGIDKLKARSLAIAKENQFQASVAEYIVQKRPPTSVPQTEIASSIKPTAVESPSTTSQAEQSVLHQPVAGVEHLNVKDYSYQIADFQAKYDWLKTAQANELKLVHTAEQLEGELATTRQKLEALRENMKAVEYTLQAQTDKLSPQEQQLIREAYQDPALRKPNDINAVADLEKVEGIVLYSPEKSAAHLSPDAVYAQQMEILETDLAHSKGLVEELQRRIYRLEDGGKIPVVQNNIEYQQWLKNSQEPERMKRGCDARIAQLTKQLEKEKEKVKKPLQDLETQLQKLVEARNVVKDQASELFESKLAAMKPDEVISIPGNVPFGEAMEVFDIGRPHSSRRAIYITTSGSGNQRVYSLVNPLDPPRPPGYNPAEMGSAGTTSHSHLFIGRTNPVTQKIQYSTPKRGEQVILKTGDEVQIGSHLDDPFNRRFFVP